MPARLAPWFVLLVGCGSVEYGGDISYGGDYGSEATYAVAEPTAIGVSPAQPQARIEIEVFFQELAPYGEWLGHPQYGQVFVPADPDYRPYRNGHWAQSGDDLVWVSYDAIGWAVCHYGSWTVLEDGRWAWIPDSQWSPAWVDWRETDQYVGWAPRMVNVDPMPSAWMFIQSTYLLYDSVAYYAVEPSYLPTVYASGRPLPSRPDRRWMRERRVQRATGGSVVTRGGGPGVGRASGGSVIVRGDGVPAARGGSVVARGPARAPLVEAPRPRETVVLGRRGVRDTVVFDQRGRSAPPVAVDRPVAAPPPRAPVYSAGPRIVAPGPTRVIRPMPSARPERVYAPPIQAPPRVYSAPVQEPRVYSRPVESAPRRVEQPRYSMPSARSAPAQAPPRREVPRRSERRVQVERAPSVRALGPGVSVRRR